MYEELIRRQREYEQRVYEEWVNRQQNANYNEDFNLDQELMRRRELLLRKKLLVFFLTFLGFYLMFEMIFSIFRSPQYVYVDKQTGKRRMVSEQELEMAERAAYARRFQNGYPKDDAFEVNSAIKRLIHEQERDKRR